jgi:RNA polymerase sigma-70 factor (ECF subfamily)
MTRDTALAEDCTQETFVNAWRALDRFETRSSLATWLHRIAVNVALGKRRKAMPVVASSEDIEVEEGASHATPGRSREGRPGPTPSGRMPAQEEAVETEWTLETPLEVKEIETAIGQLPEGARDVLVLYAIYGYSHAETAQMLGVAEGTCKAQLHRARGLLRDRLGCDACVARVPRERGTQGRGGAVDDGAERGSLT